MFREFNVKFEDVEMLGGADNLLEGTEITKVIVRGDNNKMSSLDSMLKNCNELDTIDGELDLNGVSDIDNLLEGTELVKSIDLKNINNENISANNSFPHIEQINIGGELYNKRAMQNVIASKDWTFDNINYSGTVGDNIVTKEVNIVDDNKTTIQDTLEQKARGFEIIGQTYENLVVGSGEATLLDELTLESIDGNSKEFNPHLEQPVCVEAIEGETYQNLIEGKGEYKLTDTFSATWTESNNSIENPPSMIEIPEIFGNTVQGYANVVTEKMIYDSITNSSVTTKVIMNSDNSLKISNWGDLDSWIPTDEDMEKHSIKLKPNTTYSMCAWRKETGERLGSLARVESDGFKGGHHSSYKFTTDDTGRVFLCPYGYVYNHVVRVYEGDIPNIADLYEFDLEYIQSVGDLYVDESGEPILDEEGNEQYKLEIESSNTLFDEKYLKDGFKKELYNGRYVYHATGSTIDNGLFVYNKYKFKENTQYHIKYECSNINNLGWRTLEVAYTDGTVNNYTTIINDLDGKNHIITRANKTVSRLGFSVEGRYNPLYIYADSIIISETDDNYDLIETDKTTILMPQPLRSIKTVSNGYVHDKLYWDSKNNKYFIEKVVDKQIVNINNLEFSSNEYTFITAGANTNLFKLVMNIDNIPSDFVKVDFTNNIRSNVICDKAKGYDGYEIHWNKDEICCSYDYSTRNTSGKVQLIAWRLPKEYDSVEKSIDYLKSLGDITFYVMAVPQIIETKILGKPSLETYSPKTYISTNTEIQPSQMTVINKKVDFIPLGLQANKDYTVQLDSIGKNNEFNLISLGEWKFYNSTQIRMHIKFNNMPNNIVSFNNNSSKRGFIEFINSSGVVFNVKWLDTDLVIPNDTVSMYLYIHECTLDAVLGIQPKLILKNKHCFCANLGGDNVLIENTNNTSTHHKVVVRTPATLTTDKLGLSGEGVVVNDVMLFEGGSNEIRQEVEYVEGIQNIGEVQICKNLFPNVNFIAGGLNGKGEVQASNTDMVTEDFVKIKLESSKTYCISNTENLNWVCVCFYDINKTFISQKSTSGTVLVIDSIPSNSEYVKISCYNGLKKEIKFQIEEGSIATEYQQYFEGEKYKIDILTNDDLFTNFLYDKSKNINGYELTGELTGATNDLQVNANKATTDFIKVPNNGKYYINTSKMLQPTIFQYDENKNYIPYTQNEVRVYDPWQWSTIYNGEYYTQHMNNTHYIRISLNLTDVDCLNVSLNNDKTYPSPVGKSTTQSILLPQPLNKIGELKDKFYWDDDKGHYCIEQNIDENLEILDNPKIIDLPHLNKKYSLDTYMPTTYLECTNSPMQPSRILLESDTVRYKPSALEIDTDYTIQFECKEKSDKKVKLNLGGTEKEVDAEVGLNHVSITTPSELSKDRLFLSGAGNKVSDVIVVKGEMNQYPGYFNGVQNTGELQDDGTYLIGIKTNEGFNISIQTNNPLAKGDKLYWNKSNKRYEIDRGGSIEVPTVSGDIIDLPRLYQREDTHFSTSTGNIKPSKIKLDYNDLD